MTPERYKTAFASIAPSEDLIQATLSAARQPKKNEPMRAIGLAAVVACLVIALCVSMIPWNDLSALWSTSSDPTSHYAIAVLPSSSEQSSSMAEELSPAASVEESSVPPEPTDTSHQAIIPLTPSPSEESTVISASSVESQTDISNTTLPGLYVNQLSGSVNAAKRYYPEGEYDTVTWNREQFIAHWGRDIVPSALPTDLTEDRPQHDAEVVLTKEGEVVYDPYHFTWAESFDQTYDPLRRSVTLTVSGIGMAKDLVYLIDEPVLSDIGGVEIMFGRCRMRYGPYDSETHAPAGEYDLYVAEFVCDGIDHQLITENLTLQEAYQILCSLLG